MSYYFSKHYFNIQSKNILSFVSDPQLLFQQGIVGVGGDEGGRGQIWNYSGKPEFDDLCFRDHTNPTRKKGIFWRTHYTFEHIFWTFRQILLDPLPKLFCSPTAMQGITINKKSLRENATKPHYVKTYEIKYIWPLTWQAGVVLNA